MNNSSKLINLFIDEKPVQIEDGATILQAAAKIGIAIPTLCHDSGIKPSTSCMVCAVFVEGNSSFVPSCGALAQEGMHIRTNTQEVFNERKSAIELLLSEHAGDCEGPCTAGCPAKMNIPQMLRQIAENKFDEAIATIKADIALPAILGRICPAPCEKVCRRNNHDYTVSICLLKKLVADLDLACPVPYMPQCKPVSGKKVAIIGAGPCGLATSYYLAQAGIRNVIFEKNEFAGGMLRSQIKEETLPREVLDSELNNILKMQNIEFRGNTDISGISFESLYAEYDAIFIAAGEKLTDDFGLAKTPKGLKADFHNYQTARIKVFAGGGAIGRPRFCVRAVADGKEAAASIALFLEDKKIPEKKYNHRLGQLLEGEMETFLANAANIPRCEPQNNNFSSQEAAKEASRCLHCDCMKKNACKLRDLAGLFQAKQNTYSGQRKSFIHIKSSELVFEPGKCILCGLCVQTSGQYDCAGLAFTGRGFETRISAPLRGNFDTTLTKEAAEKCAEKCPTGAIAKL